MMQECSNVRQILGEPIRRWFSDDYFDLIVWLKPEGSIYSFQLCYDKKGNEKSLRWYESGAYSHCRIDDGEGRSLRHKSAPIDVKDGLFDADVIGERFINAADLLPENIRALIQDTIQQIKDTCQPGRCT
jgi:hypothetical protein